jgi:outer membrane protein W
LPSRRFSSGTRLLLLLGLSALLPGRASGQSPSDPTNPWTFATRVVMTGSSDATRSEPEGYKVYSAFTLEAVVKRRLGSVLALEASVRTESREVSFGEDEVPVGSFEALPLNVILQYRPAVGDRFRPYVGAGLALTVVWEKAGELDSTDLPASVAPAVQLGTDVRLSSRVFLNVDLRWNPWRTSVERNGSELVRLRIDPIALGVGVGFRF